MALPLDEDESDEEVRFTLVHSNRLKRSLATTQSEICLLCHIRTKLISSRHCSSNSLKRNDALGGWSSIFVRRFHVRWLSNSSKSKRHTRECSLTGHPYNNVLASGDIWCCEYELFFTVSVCARSSKIRKICRRSAWSSSPSPFAATTSASEWSSTMTTSVAACRRRVVLRRSCEPS